MAHTASGGEVIVLDSGAYGPVEITQSVSIVAPPGIFAGVSVLPGLSGIVVNGSGIDVTLRGLSVTGQDGSIYGIDVQNAARVRVERCTTANLDTGIRNASGANVVVSDSTSAGNASYGVLASSGSTIVTRSRAEHNGTGLSLSGGGYFDAGTLVVVDVFATGNTTDGADIRVTAAQQYGLLADRLMSSGNVGAGATAGTAVLFPIYAYGTTGHAWLFDTTLDGNNDGVRIESDVMGREMLTLWGARVSRNSAHGVFATTPAGLPQPQALGYVSSNGFAGNAVGIQADANGTVYTRGNNEIPGVNPVQGNVVLQPAAYY